MGNNGDKTLRKADAIQPRETRMSTMGNKTLRKGNRPSKNGKPERVQWETRETRPSGRRTHHSLKKALRFPDNSHWATMGDKRRQDPREGGHTIQQRATRRGTRGHKRETRPAGKQTPHPTKGDKKGYDAWEGGHTIQQPTKQNKYHTSMQRAILLCNVQRFYETSMKRATLKTRKLPRS